MLAAAFIMGLLGAVHCAGMCGPLAVRACRSGGKTRGAHVLAYHAARLLGYALAGAALGVIGLRLRGPVFSAAQTAIVGLAMTLSLVRGIRLIVAPGAQLVQLGSARGFLSRVYALLPAGGAGLGLVTAVLPCGQLAAAWALAASAGAPVLGAAVMASFAAGSAPGLLAPLVASFAADRLRFSMSPKWSGVAWCGIALLLGARLLAAALAPGASCHG